LGAILRGNCIQGNLAYKHRNFGFPKATLWETSPGGPGDIEPFSGAGECHIKQATLFLFGAFCFGTGVGENAIHQAHNKNNRKFEPFGKMGGQEGDPALAIIGQFIGLARETGAIDKIP
jgi:hypothetical protein